MTGKHIARLCRFLATAASIALIATCSAGAADAVLTAEYLTDIAYSGELWWGSGIGYPRIIVLQHSQLGQNNVLLATSEEATSGLESYQPGYPIYRSTDQGKTWTQICFVQDSLAAVSSEWQPMLFELPAACGEYPAGTIFLAACSIDTAHARQSAIRLYASRDGGETFEKGVTVAVGGGLETGVWEPFLVQLDDGRLVCYYSDSTENTVHSQKLVYKVSEDGRTWGEAVDVVASSEQSDRPGMAIVTRLGDGTYFMTYELVNEVKQNGNPVTYRTSPDGLDWGDPTWLGTEIVSVDGKAMGSAPYCSWTPVGGPDGTLIVSGTFMRMGSSSTGTDYFLSTDKGKTWTTTPHVIPYRTSLDHGGYSNAMAFTADGKVMYAINNPQDPNVKDHAKLVCAMVEWVEGAAALPENTATFVETITTTQESSTTETTPFSTGTSGTPAGNDTSSSSAGIKDNDTLYTVLIVAGTVVVLGGLLTVIGIIVLRRPPVKRE